MQPTEKIIYYGGSFDPPHYGHLSALLTAMREMQAKRAVVWAQDGHNPYKPNRLAWEIRTEMLKKLFEPYPDIFTFNSWENLTLTLHNAYVILLIGDDTWPHFSNKPVNAVYKQICIATREDTPSYDFSYPKPVTLIKPPIINCSSTKIRLACAEITDEEKIPPVLNQDVPANVQQFIMNRLLYMKESVRKTIVRRRVTALIDKHLKWKIQDLELLNEQRSNISGDFPFRLRANQETYFCKVFSSHHKPLPQQRLSNEIAAISNLRDKSFKIAAAPSVTHSYFDHDKMWGFLITAFCDAPELSTFREGESLEKAYFLLGKALKEFHERRKIDPTPSKFATHTKKIGEQIAKCFLELRSNLKDIEIETLKAIYKKALDRFERNQGFLTFTHRDANPGNFLVDLQAEKVFFVDLSTFEFGYPAVDVQQVLLGLHWRQKHETFSEESIQCATRKFLEGYQYQDLINQESWDFYEIYWSLRTINSFLQTTNPHLIDKAHSLITNLILKNCKIDN
jgi:cytidyltransferase-like protein